MSTVVASGSLTATGGGTEDDIGSPPYDTAGTYVLVVDTANLVNGETVRLRGYREARSTDTQRVVYEASFSHAQSVPVKISVPLPIPTNCGLKFTLTQTGGTARAFPWSIETL
jgi:hypothetical protein